MGLCQYVCFHASFLPCLHTFWHAIPTSFLMFLFSCINSVKEKLYYVWLALLLSSLVALHIIMHLLIYHHQTFLCTHSSESVVMEVVDSLPYTTGSYKRCFLQCKLIDMFTNNILCLQCKLIDMFTNNITVKTAVYVY